MTGLLDPIFQQRFHQPSLFKCTNSEELSTTPKLPRVNKSFRDKSTQDTAGHFDRSAKAQTHDGSYIATRDDLADQAHNLC